MRIRNSMLLLFATLARLNASPDCNANGLPDAEDVASGASQDADGDGLPDECVSHLRIIAVGPG